MFLIAGTITGAVAGRLVQADVYLNGRPLYEKVCHFQVMSPKAPAQTLRLA